jgi:hypothetical protein
MVFSTNRRLSLEIKRLLFFVASLGIFVKSLLLMENRHLIRTGSPFMHIYSGAESAESAPCFCKPYIVFRES